MSGRISLNGIKSALFSSYMGSALDEPERNAEFCLKLLPDHCNPALAASPLQLIGDVAISRFFKGNRRTDKPNSYGNASFTAELLQCLKDNTPVLYMDGSPSKSCRESMLDNIRALIRSTGAKITPDHPVFTEYSPSEPEYQSNSEFIQLAYALRMLRAANTDGSMCYAVFLLVLCSIFWKDMHELTDCFTPETIFEATSQTSGGIWDLSEKQTLFTDPHYMNEYHVYLYKSTKRGGGILYQNASLTISNAQSPLPAATLTMDIGSESDIQFTGTPLFSANDDMVYIIMRSTQDRLGILCFKYEAFSSGNMYFRTGLLLTGFSGSHEPSVQKVIITARCLAEDEYPLADGYLKSFTDTLYLTDEQLAAFREKFRDQAWMDQFTDVFLPFIQLHKRTLYTITEKELLFYSMGNLSDLDRLRAMLSLRSVEGTDRSDAIPFFRLSEPADLYRLMKPSK